jgi:hypothetical protein
MQNAKLQFKIQNHIDVIKTKLGLVKIFNFAL